MDQEAGPRAERRRTLAEGLAVAQPGDKPTTDGLRVITGRYIARHVQYGRLSQRFRVLANETRGRLVAHLTEGECKRGEVGSSLQSFADMLAVPGDWLAARNQPLGYHYDTIPEAGRTNLLVVFRDGVTGGELCFPSLGVALACEDLSVAHFDGRELLHGSTEVEGDGYRIALTFYG